MLHRHARILVTIEQVCRLLGQHMREQGQKTRDKRQDFGYNGPGCGHQQQDLSIQTAIYFTKESTVGVLT